MQEDLYGVYQPWKHERGWGRNERELKVQFSSSKILITIGVALTNNALWLPKGTETSR